MVNRTMKRSNSYLLQVALGVLMLTTLLISLSFFFPHTAHAAGPANGLRAGSTFVPPSSPTPLNR
jgi:hypothetical protein